MILERGEFKASPPVEQIGDFAVSSDVLTPEIISEIEGLLRDKILYDESYKNHREWKVIVHNSKTSPLDQKASVALRCLVDYTSYLHYLVVQKRIYDKRVTFAKSEIDKMNKALENGEPYFDEWGDEISRDDLLKTIEECTVSLEYNAPILDKLVKMIEREMA